MIAKGVACRVEAGFDELMHWIVWQISYAYLVCPLHTKGGMAASQLSGSACRAEPSIRNAYSLRS